MSLLAPELEFTPLFQVSADSEFSDYLTQGLKLLEFKPEILEMIFMDQYDAAIKEKIVRLADKAFLAGDNADCSFLPIDSNQCSINTSPLVENIELKTGRPRMSPKTLYVYYLSEQFLEGSTTNRLGKCFLSESGTLRAFLANSGIKKPGKSTVHENLRVLSDKTRQFIFDAQIEYIYHMQLDIFDELYIDSTAINANSEWPTDSGLILKLVSGLDRLLGRMNTTFDLAYSDKVIKRWIKELAKMDFQINLSLGKKNSRKVQKKNYKKIYALSDKAVARLLRNYILFMETYNQYEILPSLKVRIDNFIGMFETSLSNLKNLSTYSYERVFEGKKAPACEKIASITDENASFIIKGGRDTVVGYKPQIGVSANMFIVSILLPAGNASDSGMLLETVRDSIGRTGVTPTVVGVDDGYSSADNYKSLIDMGVTTASISGSKGKAVIQSVDDTLWDTPEYSDARNNRSKAESMMFSLKYLFDFGQLKARGLENVRREVLGKAIGYNFHRMTLLASSALDRESA